MGNRYSKDLKDQLLALNSPFNALLHATQRYIQVRQSWLDSSCWGSFGWRGGFTSGKLFFNKRLTKNNIDNMKTVISIIQDENLNDAKKVHEIDIVRRKLSKNGRSRELLDTFLRVIGLNAKSTSLGKDNNWGECIITNGRIYTLGEVIGIGSNAESYTLQSRGGKNLAVKRFMPPHFHNDEKVEIDIFEHVYNTLEPVYLPQYQEVEFDYHMWNSNSRSHSFAIMPLIEGIGLNKYINQHLANNKYEELEIIGACADFLYSLHSIGVIHGDLVMENIIVVNDFLDIFLIDYGCSSLTETSERDKRLWKDGILKDLSSIIIIVTVRCKRVRNAPRGRTIDLGMVLSAMRIDRWLNNRSFCNGGEQLQFINGLLEYADHYRDSFGLQFNPIFDPGSVNRVRQQLD